MSKCERNEVPVFPQPPSLLALPPISARLGAVKSSRGPAKANQASTTSDKKKVAIGVAITLSREHRRQNPEPIDESRSSLTRGMTLAKHPHGRMRTR